jgi:hypothetical protein
MFRGWDVCNTRTLAVCHHHCSASNKELLHGDAGRRSVEYTGSRPPGKIVFRVSCSQGNVWWECREKIRLCYYYTWKSVAVGWDEKKKKKNAHDTITRTSCSATMNEYMLLYIIINIVVFSCYDFLVCVYLLIRLCADCIYNCRRLICEKRVRFPVTVIPMYAHREYKCSVSMDTCSA